MGHVLNHTYIDASPEHVFDIASQLERLPEWQANLVEIRDVTGPGDRVGTRWTAIMKIGGRKLEATWEISAVDRPAFIEMRGTAPGGGQATTVNRFTREGTGTDAAFQIDYELPGGFLGGFADKLFVERSIERDVKHSGENFKAACEASVPAAV